ncbi:hypothetical protein [Streptomyces sp. 8N616]|uniref:hypothetical protein n=1 Tax=Streptomyces sp. 8N616 TaxID=3457414 RepID=UPI003FD133F5
MRDALADGEDRTRALVTQHGGHRHLVFLSAGVETVSRYVKGDSSPVSLTSTPTVAT